LRRSRAEVIIDILNAAKEESGKTRIMYDANMNLASFNKYLRKLTKAGLIVRIEGSHDKVVYRTTERGINLLQLLEKVEEFISF